MDLETSNRSQKNRRSNIFQGKIFLKKYIVTDSKVMSTLVIKKITANWPGCKILYGDIPEIRMDILLYEKGGIVKHINAPAIDKVQLSDLLKHRTHDDVE